MKYLILIAAACACFFSCENKRDMHVVETQPVIEQSITTVNERDPICNMEVKGNLSDTALIDNKVWGFCSSACKEKYLHSK